MYSASSCSPPEQNPKHQKRNVEAEGCLWQTRPDPQNSDETEKRSHLSTTERGRTKRQSGNAVCIWSSSHDCTPPLTIATNACLEPPFAKMRKKNQVKYVSLKWPQSFNSKRVVQLKKEYNSYIFWITSTFFVQWMDNWAEPFPFRFDRDFGRIRNARDAPSKSPGS